MVERFLFYTVIQFLYIVDLTAFLLIVNPNFLHKLHYVNYLYFNLKLPSHLLTYPFGMRASQQQLYFVQSSLQWYQQMKVLPYILAVSIS